MINRWTIKLWANNLTIQIPSLNYNNTYTGDSKYWSILLFIIPIQLNPIHTYTWIKNSKNKNNNLQKSLTNTVTIIFFFFRLLTKYLLYMLTLNLIRKPYIPMNNSHWLDIRVKTKSYCPKSYKSTKIQTKSMNNSRCHFFFSFFFFFFCFGFFVLLDMIIFLGHDFYFLINWVIAFFFFFFGCLSLFCFN